MEEREGGEEGASRLIPSTHRLSVSLVFISFVNILLVIFVYDSDLLVTDYAWVCEGV